jgi:hypothetical protein
LARTVISPPCRNRTIRGGYNGIGATVVEGGQ